MTAKHDESRRRHAEAAACKQCGEPAHSPTHRYDAWAQPYNPDWPLDRFDAGIFCTRQCLIDYLTAAEVRPDDQ